MSVAGEWVEEVDKFTYLGSIVSKKGGTDEGIKARIGKARKALTTKTKLRVFGSNVNDLALLSHRIQDMRDKTRALEVQSAKVGLKINATKTKRIGT